MNDPIELALSGPAHVVEPPIIDLLAFDAELDCYVAEFVPDGQVSAELKESVFISRKGPVARRLSELLQLLGVTLKLSSPVTKIAHAGGGSFDISTSQGSVYHLHESASPQVSFDVYAVLQVLSQEVQLEFITQRMKNLGVQDN